MKGKSMESEKLSFHLNEIGGAGGGIEPPTRGFSKLAFNASS
jgi:hypothetical protein